MTQERLAEIRALCDAATPGPWVAISAEGCCEAVKCYCNKDREDEACEECEDFRWTQGAFIDEVLTINCGEYDGMNDDDVKFIAAARSVVPELLAEVERQAEIIDAYATAARVIAVHLDKFCDRELTYDQMIAEAARRAGVEVERQAAEIERLKAGDATHNTMSVADEMPKRDGVKRCATCGSLNIINAAPVYATCTRTGLVFKLWEHDTREECCGNWQPQIL